jgi:hypothetical protein
MSSIEQVEWKMVAASFKVDVLIDDCRDFGGNTVICRTGENGIITIMALLKAGVTIERLYMDHDLGDGINGYQVIEILAKNGLLPNFVEMVTSNPVGRERMAQVLESEGFSRLGTVFTRNEIYG